MFGNIVVKLPVCLLMFFTSAALAAATPTAASIFERLQTLVGTWEGKLANGRILRVTYRLSAAKTVLVETWALAADRESMTLYHLDGKNLVATHYCPIGNQPTLQLSQPSDGSTLVFDFKSATNLPSQSISHQHRFELRLLDQERFWRSESYLEDGKLDTEEVIYTRLSSNAGEPKLDARATTHMQCGELRCEIAAEYCAREFLIEPIPGSIRHSCRKLPRPECGNQTVGGTCLGDAKNGFILDIVYP